SGVLERHFCKAFLSLSGSGYILIFDGRMAEMKVSQFIHAMSIFTAVKVIGHNHGIIVRDKLDSLIFKDVKIIFNILADFEDGRVFQNLLQEGECSFKGNLLKVR